MADFKKRYEEAQRVSDTGEKLLVLYEISKEINHKIEALEAGDLFKERTRFERAFVPTLLGTSVGVSVAMALLLPGPLFVSLGVITIVSMGCGAGSTFLIDPIDNLIHKKERRGLEAEVDALKEICSEVLKATSALVGQEDLKVIAASPRCADVLQAFPDLRTRFKVAARKATEKQEMEELRQTVLKVQPPPLQKNNPPKPFEF